MAVMDATASEAASSQSKPGHDLKRHVGMIGLLFTAVGSIIGSGWLFGALNAAEQAGPASVISWLLGAIMILFIGLTYAELGTMFPLSGGVVRFPHFAFGSFASYTTGWITWLAAASVAPIEVEGALQYAANYLPWLGHLTADGIPVLSTPGYFVAAALMLLFSIINLVGIRWFARLNNAIVWWKLGIICLVIIAFFVSAFHIGHFTQASHAKNEADGFMPFGWHGVFSSIATAGIVFSYLGFRQGVELAGETNNPKRNVPIALIGSVVLCGLIYIALQAAFIGALPTGALSHGWAAIGDWNHIGAKFTGSAGHRTMAFGPLASLASTLGMAWLAILLYIDAVVSPTDTGMIFTTVAARLSYAMGRNENAPRGLAKINRWGVPWVSVLLAFVVGLIFFLPFPGWRKLVGFVTSATVLSFASGPLVLIAMRKELPERARPFRLAGGVIIPYLAFLSSNLIVYWSGWTTTWKLMVAVLIGLAILALHEGLQGKHTPRMDWRSGFWLLPWLGGLTIISWVGAYPIPSKHAGNLAALGLSEAIGVIAVFSALIMWLAYALRLPGKRMEEYLQEAVTTEPV